MTPKVPTQRENCTVFSSYRRSGGVEAPNRVYEALRTEFDTFMDVRDLISGPYPPALLIEIEKRDAFVLILTPESLDRWHEEGDSLKMEITHAIELKKHIIPFVSQGFTWPKLPEEMAGLPKLQAVQPSPEYPVAPIEKLKEYLGAIQPTASEG